MSYFINTLKKFGFVCPKTIVETGTYLGHGIRSYLETSYFDHIYSIELSPKYVHMNQESFRNEPSVKIFEGDSTTIIEAMIKNGSLANEPILFYLDAHFSGGDTAGETISNGCPVLSELKAICSRNIKGDIVFVDDMRLMGKASWSGDGGVWPITFFNFTHVSNENLIDSIKSRDVKFIQMCEDTDRLVIVFD